MNAHEWYYKSPTNEELGPFTAADLKRLVSTGRINRTTMVRKGPDGRWVAAANVKGLDAGKLSGATAVPTVPPVRTASRVRPGESPGRPEVSPLSDPEAAAARSSAVGTRKALPPIVLVGASVFATLTIVGVVGLAVLLFTRSDKRTPQAPVQSNAVPTGGTETTSRPSPPSQATTSPKEAVQGASPSALASPEAVVRAYLGAKVWEERLQFVLNPQQVRPQMEEHYWNAHLTSSAFLPGTIVSVEGPKEPIGAKCVVTVDVSTSTPDSPRLHYPVVRTEEGFKIDWTESQVLSRKDDEDAFRKQLGNPEVAMEVLRWHQSYSSAEIEFKLINNSRVILDYVEVTIDILNSKGDYIG